MRWSNFSRTRILYWCSCWLCWLHQSGHGESGLEAGIQQDSIVISPLPKVLDFILWRYSLNLFSKDVFSKSKMFNKSSSNNLIFPELAHVFYDRHQSRLFWVSLIGTNTGLSFSTSTSFEILYYFWELYPLIQNQQIFLHCLINILGLLLTFQLDDVSKLNI